MEIYERIKLCRGAKGFSQVDMAEKLDISLLAYSNIERGKTELTIKRLEQLATFLSVGVGDLMGFDGIDSLTKRILELEDRLRDKDNLNEALERRNAENNDILDDFQGALYMDIIQDFPKTQQGAIPVDYFDKNKHWYAFLLKYNLLLGNYGKDMKDDENFMLYADMIANINADISARFIKRIFGFFGKNSTKTKRKRNEKLN